MQEPKREGFLNFLRVAMLKLYKYGPAWGTLDMSPFCLKVEVYFQLMKIAYTPQVANAQKAPKQKLPSVNLEGQVLCDSALIVAHFEANSPHPLDAGMTPLEISLAKAYGALFEEKLYFVTAWARWADDAAWAVYREPIKVYFGKIGVPKFLHGMVAKMARKQVLKSIWVQGIGRHSRDEIYAMGADILQTASVFLGDKPYFLGEQVRTIDATVYAFLSAILDVPIETALKQAALNLPNLAAYCARMKTKLDELNQD